MITHNLLIAYRNFVKYKSSFFINLIGLSSGLACFLMIILWVNDELNMDQFFENRDRLFQVMENVDQGNGMITRITTAGPTAEAMTADFPEVELAVTATLAWGNNHVLSFAGNDLKAKGIYASSAFFRMFSFRLLQGQPEKVLSDKKAIVISRALAIRLFGTEENVIGKIIELQHKDQLHVTGLMDNVPNSSSAQFEFVVTWEKFRDENEWVTNWFNTAPQTYILLAKGTDVGAFNKKIFDMVRAKTEGKANHRSPFVRRYADGYLYGRYENGVLAGGRIDYVRLFSVIAVFILLIACINFMNLSTAQASRRIKEVGIKKAVGARQRALVFQYLAESIMMALFSLFVALLIVLLLLPQFNAITEKQLTLKLTVSFTLTLAAIVLITGFMSGSYPALYLSKFNPVTVLKGKLNNLVGEVWIRKGLVMFQFTLSIILIVSVWVVYQQISFIQNKNLGFDKDNVMIFSREGAVSEKQEAFLAELEKIPGVIAASNTGHDMTGHNGGTYGIEWDGKNPDDRTEFERVSVNYGIIELLGVKMKEGRTFSKEFSTDDTKIIFNEAAIAFMGMKDPIGKKIKLWDKEVEIIGVAQNFNFDSFHEQIKPLFFFLNPGNSSHIMVKIEKGKEQETIARIEKFYNVFNAGFPFEYRFLDEDYQNLYAAERRVATLSKYFAGLAVLISSLGLFGLAAFTAERRMKEIGIRKILGSSIWGIVSLLSADFTKMVVVAIVIAIPLSWLMANSWLDSFVFRINLEWWWFACSAVTALIIAWATVGLQTFNAARINPTKCLRSE